MSHEILDNLLRLEKGEITRFSFLWNPRDPHFLDFQVLLPGGEAYITRVIQWPLLDGGRGLDTDRMKAEGGKLVWLTFTEHQLLQQRMITKNGRCTSTIFW